ncbi:MarR family winged helix-turn-helix transcriptional regulator [Croceicoccus bisphenolivorans]|uniref:MarR family winged helix-turn-helix transcriptional regulator n=1 Tax=Croceicoccus bisphenolivorans TaxID=1783232 RepID=UPI001560E430|nr:MarR family transcriptional regulator [Croceicoccus bisphenolivorans]
MPDADGIARFRDRPGVWLSFGGAAFYSAYRDRLVPLGLRPSWVTALAIIEQHPGISQAALGRKLCVNRASSMATSVQLAEAGLVSREPLPGRNRTGLTITGKGLERLEAACLVEEQMIAGLMDGIPDQERAVFFSVLRTLAGRISRKP